MQTEKTRQERLRKWLNLYEEQRKQRLASRSGTLIGKSIGSSLLAGGSVAPDNSPDGEKEESDGDKEKLTEALEYGDEVENLELYDCETGEKVTLDGFGGNGSQPKYPLGFVDCKAEKKPTMEELDGKTIYRTEYIKYQGSTSTDFKYTLDTSEFESARIRAHSECQAYADSGSSSTLYDYKVETNQSTAVTENVAVIRYPKGQTTGGILVFSRVASLEVSESTAFKQAYINNFVAPTWDENDKNHLKLGSDNCFGTLCPDHNNQVSPKYQGCQDELVLCDENGKKNKVTVNPDGTVDILQGDFNQVSTVKNGKVVSVKKLTEAQKEREFK